MSKPASEAEKGIFVVVDGPDGAGKSTLVARLADRLRGDGVDFIQVREPGGTKAAELARQGAFDPALDASAVAELFFVLAARADLVAKVIRPALQSGKLVLSDRYVLSTEAYQIAGRGLPAKQVLVANGLATGGLAPDLTLILDVPTDVGRARQAAQGKELDRMEREAVELHERVRGVFGGAGGGGVAHVDASGSPESVEEEAWGVLVERFGEHLPKLTGTADS